MVSSRKAWLGSDRASFSFWITTILWARGVGALGKMFDERRKSRWLEPEYTNEWNTIGVRRPNEKYSFDRGLNSLGGALSGISPGSR